MIGPMRDDSALDVALMAVDYAAVAAHDLATALEAAAQGDPQDLQSALRKALRLLREAEASINEALPTARHYFERAP